ncbi:MULTISPECIES: hypothetical protein [unclassified Nostoc]|uniref:hypothetical protein n=1 Tax=unclassified Nostoc TaxID=2593658 RepID=UPI000CF3413A|nr:hypothetical protein [Nostoc sp. 'Peltigera membranacea cyanobiont' N6]AVH65355.1 hypothetical protein NPM_3791 [Nostoc sp. 'Peltigera membranacea cyanobiont' N6]
MNEIVKKLAGLGLPGVILVILAVTSGGSSAAVAATLTALGGPFGIVGGIALLGLITVAGDAVAGYGIEAILKAIYEERSKTESVTFLLNEIKDLPITEELKLKLKNELRPENITNAQKVEIPKVV